MAESGRYTRRIVEGGEAYRWRVREGERWDQVELLVFSINHPRGEAIRCLLRPQTLGNGQVTPSVVAEFIRRARVLGWDPCSPGSAPSSEALLCDTHPVEAE